MSRARTAPTPSHPEALAEMYHRAPRVLNECWGFVYGTRTPPPPTAPPPASTSRTASTPWIRRRTSATPDRLLTRATDLSPSKSLRTAEPVKVIYHSHIDVGAYFSPTDQTAATMDGEPSYPVEYIVIDVQKDGARGAAQFCWSDAEKKYVEVGRYPGA